MNSGTLSGMKPLQILRVVIAGYVLSSVWSVVGNAQSAAPAAASVEASRSHQVFRITPVRPIAELVAEALKAKPPKEKGPFASPKLAEIAKADSSIHLDIRYATSNNFLGEPVYPQARALLQAPAGEALIRVSTKLHEKGYGLLVFDAYRPWYVTKIFWEATPSEKREFVSDPAQGSRHNRGCAVDLTLYELKTGAAVAMPSEYDEMSPRAYADYGGGTPKERKDREILRKAMESEGFLQRANEWWHYDYKDWRNYEILNLPFSRFRDPAIYNVGNGVTAPKVLKRVDPEFSAEAKGKNGTVAMSLVVDEDGIPKDIRMVRNIGYGLDVNAMNALRQWRFEPAKKDGKAVPVRVNVEVRFTSH